MKPWKSSSRLSVAMNQSWRQFTTFQAALATSANQAHHTSVLTLPIIASFAVSIAHFVSLYRLRVAIPPRQLFGAVFAAMSVQWTVARAVGFGLIKDHLAFNRTAKGGSRRAGDYHATSELVIAGLLILGAVTLYMTNYKQVHEIYIFAVVLLVQSIPFLSAAFLAALERSRLNDYAYWRVLEARLGELLPGRVRSITKAPSVAPASAPVVNNQTETAA